MSAPTSRGGASVGRLSDLDPIEAGAVMYLRLWGDGPKGRADAASDFDIALGADHLKMGLTEVRLGIIPATIGPYVLARMGEGRARRVFFAGRLFDAAEAVELGLLAKICPVDDLNDAVEAEVAPYLNAAPGAVASAKALTRALSAAIDERTIEMTITALKERWETDEAQEGIGAFFDKRKAHWMQG